MKEEEEDYDDDWPCDTCKAEDCEGCWIYDLMYGDPSDLPGHRD